MHRSHFFPRKGKLSNFFILVEEFRHEKPRPVGDKALEQVDLQLHVLYKILQDLQKQLGFYCTPKGETEHGIDEIQGCELQGASFIYHPVQTADASRVLFSS